MPDKKLTDNEVVKVLECCSEPVGKGCYDCPLHLKDCLNFDVFKLALDLINRLQAENKRLSTLAELGNTRANDYRVMRDRALKAEAENERLKRYESITSHDLPVIPPLKISKPKDEVAEIKFEAYKEFAERLKKKIFFVNIHNCEKAEIKCIDLKPKHIDNLLKELVGEDK